MTCIKICTKFHAYLNTCHPNKSSLFEKEINSKLPLLDIVVSWQGKFVTAVYRKPTFSSVRIPILIVFGNNIQSWYDIHSSLPMC